MQTANGDPSWTLLDRLGTTAAQAVGGSVTQLSTFDDWGNQSFETIGWNAAVNYTGETTDAGYGLNNYYARTYDPTTGSWMAQDSWRGLLAEPQTLSRYAYVNNSPATLVDALGNKPYDPPMRVNGKNADGWVYVETPPTTGTVISIGDDDDDDDDGGGGEAADPSDNDSAVSETHSNPCKGAGKFQVCQNNGAYNEDIDSCLENPITAQVCELLLTLATLGAIKGISGAAPRIIAVEQAPAAIAPAVSTPKLQNLIANIFKGASNPSRVGDGTLMAALKEEARTGLPVGGKFHTGKATDTINGLKNFLKNNPGAPASERELAQSYIDQITKAMKGEY